MSYKLKVILLISHISILTSHICIAQSAKIDTVYFNEDWNETTKDKAEFYRLIKRENNLYVVQDYYKNKVLQMEGSFTSLHPELYEGYFKYFNEKGILIKEG